MYTLTSCCCIFWLQKISIFGHFDFWIPYLEIPNVFWPLASLHFLVGSGIHTVVKISGDFCFLAFFSSLFALFCYFEFKSYLQVLASFTCTCNFCLQFYLFSRFWKNSEMLGFCWIFLKLLNFVKTFLPAAAARSYRGVGSVQLTFAS